VSDRQKESGLSAALDGALTSLRSRQYEEVAVAAGCEWDRQAGILHVPYFGRTVGLRLPGGEFVPEGMLSLREKVLVVRYLIGCPQGRGGRDLIGFNELEAGSIYLPSIRGRVYRPLISAFADHPELLRERSAALGGEEVSEPEGAVRFQVFPRVAVFLIFRPADEEFPADCTILFESEARTILTTEDMVVLWEEIAEKLVGHREGGQASPPIQKP